MGGYLSESLSVIICSRIHWYVCVSLILSMVVCFQMDYSSCVVLWSVTNSSYQIIAAEVEAPLISYSS